ncbi:glycosyltransferase involved in cell wall biosynthesis [Neobacillus niacini]|uniref:glycosyltransferase family 2 protein n=1 Tax=Neobacillus niacini TaxID=86668 RepID=UPI00277E619A|nr:glycosyltransferase [Neobacillus niacini]MDQ1003606.1 glycosyltransferase involved in cell wall biosynthesis [Neobacillus niacini]
MGTQPFISIIIPAKNEGGNVKSTLDSLLTVQTNFLYEVIIVNDASVDGCCDFLSSYKNKDIIKLIQTNGIGAANARNLGAKNSSGDFLIFCDAHLEFEDWWIDHLVAPLIARKTDAVCAAIASKEDPSLIGYGQTLNTRLGTKWNTKRSILFETPIIPGGCFAITKTAFEDVGGFETGFKTWGHEDVELSIKLWLFGYRCHVQPKVKILHLFRKSHPYKVSYDDVNYNLLRMAYSHFNVARIGKCKKLIHHGKSAAEVETEVVRDGVRMQRKRYFAKRKYDDEWYFKKFNINF